MGNDGFDWLGTRDSSYASPTSLQQLAANNNFSMGNGAQSQQNVLPQSDVSYMNPGMMGSNSMQGAQGNNQVPSMSLEQIANINMLHQLGRSDLANQAMQQYGASLPPESGWNKFKNIMTGSPDYSLSGWQQGLQTALPVGMSLYKLLSANNFIHRNPNYMTNLASSQQPQLQAAVRPQ